MVARGPTRSALTPGNSKNTTHRRGACQASRSEKSEKLEKLEEISKEEISKEKIVRHYARMPSLDVELTARELECSASSLKRTWCAAGFRKIQDILRNDRESRARQTPRRSCWNAPSLPFSWRQLELAVVTKEK